MLLYLLPLLVLIICFPPTAEAAMTALRQINSGSTTLTLDDNTIHSSVKTIGKIFDYRKKKIPRIQKIVQKNLSQEDLYTFLNILSLTKEKVNLLKIPQGIENISLKNIEELGVMVPSTSLIQPGLMNGSKTVLRRMLFLRGGILGGLPAALAVGGTVFREIFKIFKTEEIRIPGFSQEKKEPLQETVKKTSIVAIFLILIFLITGQKKRLPPPVQQTINSLFPEKKSTITEWAIEHFKTSVDYLIRHPQYVILLAIAFKFRKQMWSLSTNPDARTEFVTKSFEFIHTQQKEAKELINKLNSLQKEWMDKFYKTGQAFTTHELGRLEIAEKQIESLRTQLQTKEQVVHEMEKSMIENSHMTKNCENDVNQQKTNYKALYDYIENVFKANPSVKSNLPAVTPTAIDQKMVSYTQPLVMGKEIEKRLINENR